MARLRDLWPPTLHTSRLRLDLFNNSPEHYTVLLNCINSPTAHATLGDLYIRTPEQFAEFCSTSLLRDPRLSSGRTDQIAYYILCLPETNELIGGVSLSQRSYNTSSEENLVLPPDIGWAVLELFMGKGYATEAATELLRFAREDFGLKEICVFPDDGNKRSNRVAEKLGFLRGGECSCLDAPGKTLSIWILPGMQRMDERFKGGLSLKH